jgi:hypothetical protein
MTSDLIPITFEGKLTSEERETLGGLKQTEPFRLLRKICASEYAVVCDQLPMCENERDLLVAQGQLRGIRQIYNLLVTLGAEKINTSEPLPIHRQILKNSGRGH